MGRVEVGREGEVKVANFLDELGTSSIIYLKTVFVMLLNWLDSSEESKMIFAEIRAQLNYVLAAVVL